jgi:hypothetical protein
VAEPIYSVMCCSKPILNQIAPSSWRSVWFLKTKLVAARPGSDEDESCAVGSSSSRSFQRRWRCRDRSPVAEEPRITAPELWAARGGASDVVWG